MNQVPVKCPGTRYLAFKSQVLVSSGIVSLDSVLGGGIPVGSVVLIEEDEDNVYAQMILKYFYAEAVSCKQRVFLAALSQHDRNMIYRLPGVVEPAASKTSNENDVEMKIAWRYQENPEVNSAPSRPGVANLGHHFDLSSTLPPTVIEASNITLWPPKDECTYNALLKDLLCQLKDSGGNQEVWRVGVHSVGSALWEDGPSGLPRLLYGLRAVAQNNPAVIVVTLPAHLLQENYIVTRCAQLSDAVIQLESLADSSSPLYTDYKGLIKFTKFPAINTISAHVPEATDWGFKLRKKKFFIEKLHLPPELQESSQREQDDLANLSCASNKSVSLDF